MTLSIKSIALAVVAPLVFVGCTTTNPQAAFNGVDKAVADRSGQHIRWMRRAILPPPQSSRAWTRCCKPTSRRSPPSPSRC